MPRRWGGHVWAGEYLLPEDLPYSGDAELQAVKDVPADQHVFTSVQDAHDPRKVVTVACHLGDMMKMAFVAMRQETAGAAAASALKRQLAETVANACVTRKCVATPYDNVPQELPGKRWCSTFFQAGCSRAREKLSQIHVLNAVMGLCRSMGRSGG